MKGSLNSDYKPNIVLVTHEDRRFFEYDITAGIFYIPGTDIPVDPIQVIFGEQSAADAGDGNDWINTAFDHSATTMIATSIVNEGVKTVAKEFVRQVAINNRLTGIENGKLPKTYNATRSIGNKLGVVGGAIIVGDILYNSEIKASHGINTFMTVIAFSGWGAPIAGLWFVTDVGVGLITGASISDRIDANTVSLDWDW